MAMRRRDYECISLGCAYLGNAFGDDLVPNARLLLNGIEFDTMIGTGVSGTSVAPVLARALGVGFCIVRKDSDWKNSHSSAKVEGYLGRRWLFVDDLISMGNTLSRVLVAIESIPTWRTEFVGAYLYGTSPGIGVEVGGARYLTREELVEAYRITGLSRSES